MLNRLNIYILKKFLLAFFVTFLIFTIILIIGDFVEQFRKAAGKEIAINIIMQLTFYNLPNLIQFTMPLTAFFGSVITFIILIRNSEKIIIGSIGISHFKITVPGIVLYFVIGIFFITVANPLIAIFDERYSELEYRYIDKVDKFASITKNGIWLKQENDEKKVNSVLYAKNIRDQGKNLIDFMVLEYDQNGSFQGRIDGSLAKLDKGYWIMENVQITPKYDSASFAEKIYYQTNIKPEDITDSLSTPTSISIWRLAKFISFLEDLGYSAIDFKMHFYGLIFLPFFIASLVLLSSSLVINLNQNDKFTNTVIISLILIFIVYFLSNLFDALGSTSQINPILSKALLPLLITLLSLIIYQYKRIKRILN